MFSFLGRSNWPIEWLRSKPPHLRERNRKSARGYATTTTLMLTNSMRLGAASRNTCQNGKFHGITASTTPIGLNVMKLLRASVGTWFAGQARRRTRLCRHRRRFPHTIPAFAAIEIADLLDDGAGG
jgi:hypothetical protein